MKIVYCLIDSSQAGGMERSICCKANYFADVMGYDVTIITTDRESRENFFDFSSKTTFFDLGINYRELDGLPIFKRLKNQIQKRKEHRLRLEQILRKIQADIVISTCTHEVSILCKMKDGSRKIAESHLSKDHKKVEVSLSNQSLLSKLFTLITDFRRKRFLKYYDALVVLSESEKRLWEEFNNRIVSIPNPLPFFFDSTTDCTQKRVISVGRLSKEKGFSYLIDAWRLVSQKHSDWELVIFGNGAELGNLQKQISDLGLKNNIRIHPSVKNISDEYLKSSLYVMPSISEAFGLVLPEAMSCGLPCIAFKCSDGLSEIITNGENGFLVEARNTDKLSEKISFLIENEQLRKQMGQNARASILRFLPENTMPQWVDLFSEIKEG